MMTKRIKHNLAGLIFALLGVYFLVTGDMGHDMHTDHSTKLFGLGEMTWMWFTMAIVHFFLNDCQCKHCKEKT